MCHISFLVLILSRRKTGTMSKPHQIFKFETLERQLSQELKGQVRTYDINKL